MGSPFGYNVLGLTGNLWPHLERLQPNALLFLDNAGGAEEAARRLPQCRVIHRIYKPDEAVMHRTPGATLTYLQARAPEVSSGIYINVATEPDISRPDDLQRLVDEQLKALQWAQSRGVRVAALHLAHYGLDERHWPTLEPIASYIASHPAQFLFCCDEYGAGTMFSGVLDPALPGGNEAGHVQPETWKASPVPHYYHIGRITNFFRWLKARCKTPPPTVITEHGVDALGDVTDWRNSLVRTPGFDDIRGWQSLRRQWEVWYGARGWTAERAYVEMLAAAWREIYAPWPNVLSALIYCWGTNNDRQWDQFRVDGAAEFQTRLEAVKVTTGEPPVSNPTTIGKPDDAGQPVRATLTRGGYRIRKGPGTGFDVMTTTQLNEEVTYYPFEVEKARANGFEWVWVEAVSGSGFMAHEGQFAPVTTPEPPAVTARTTLAGWVFVDQSGADAAPPNACGPASGAMAVNYKRANQGGPMVSALAFSQAMGRTPGQPTTLEAIHDTLRDQFEIDAEYRAAKEGNPVDAAAIRAHIQAGGMVIGLVERGNVPGAAAIYPYTRAHIGVFVAEAEGHLWFADPLILESAAVHTLVMTDAEANEALKQSTWQAANGTVTTNSGFQALLVEPPDTPEPPPIDPDFHAAVLGYTARLEHAATRHNEATHTATQEYALEVASVVEGLRGLIGHS